ncbi:threonine dehydrogenase [Microdochium trichocladiopsis]|uniref:Threonine dehydrogenase n=1 Tax=Microdochium trichocladiopsis TaxID=1682393 RepID=A0A9P8XY01_9PEZI|nr:threonine dehydrogenase [Microdochium trichocladiopsis]KAH7021482.1 threonine dehydrogenase [Microdochium trichocladiopsis]
MRAARFHDTRDVRVEDIEAPVQTGDKVLVQVEWCGICGSDLHEYTHGPFGTSTKERGPHPLTGDPGPVVLGHEFTGRIAHTQAGSQLEEGQLVVVDPRIHCSDCRACNEDAGQCCRMPGFLGFSGGGGGLSEIVAVDPKKVHVLPDGTDLAAAALIEPLAVAWHAVRRLGPADFAGLPVLVLGGGPVGVAVVFVLRALGADKIILSEPTAARRVFFEPLVLDSINPLEVDVTKRVRELTGRDGVDFVVDCAGAERGFIVGCESLRYRGVYANLALPKTDLALPSLAFILKELTYRAFLAYGEKDFAETVAAFTAGRFKGVEKMITSRLSLDEIVDKGFEVLIGDSQDEIKILASPKR